MMWKKWYMEHRTVKWVNSLYANVISRGCFGTLGSSALEKLYGIDSHSC